METTYLQGIIKQFEYYKLLGEKAIIQVPDEKLNWKFNDESNSIATIVKHLWGNMLSRWTEFLTTDGEKEWRDRDAEFEDESMTRTMLLEKWSYGWKILLNTLDSLKEADLEKTIYIRNESHIVMDAINRQLAHYAYHIGQIVFISKFCAQNWNTLSIAKGSSKQFNEVKFSKPKHDEHYTNELLQNKINKNP